MDQSKQCRLRSDSLLLVFSVCCFEASLHCRTIGYSETLLHYRTVPFVAIKLIMLGVPIFRNFAVFDVNSVGDTLFCYKTRFPLLNNPNNLGQDQDNLDCFGRDKPSYSNIYMTYISKGILEGEKG